MIDLELSASPRAEAAASPAPWLHLFDDGTFQAGSVTYAQRSAVRTVVHSTRVVKEPGEGQPLTLTKDKHCLELVYRDGRWAQRWVTSAPIAFADEETLPELALAGNPAELPYAEPLGAEIIEPAEAPARPRRSLTLLAPLLLVALLLAVSLGFAPTRLHLLPARHAEHVRFDEATWTERHAYHTLVTHAFFAPRGAELAYLAVGVLLFGWLAARNVGTWRTLALFAWSAALGVGLWRFLHTSLGQAMLDDVLGKFFRFLTERGGLSVAWTAWLAFLEGYHHAMSLRGPVSGAAGAVSGLIAFAVCRRSFTGGRFPYRFLALALGAAYVAIGWAWLWPVALGGPAPYILFVGGALAGWSFCFPDKALEHFGDSLKNALANQREPSSGQA